MEVYKATRDADHWTSLPSGFLITFVILGGRTSDPEAAPQLGLETLGLPDPKLIFYKGEGGQTQRTVECH